MMTKLERHVELAKAALQLQQVGLNEDALELLEKVIRLAPGYATAYILQGLSLQAIDRLELAEKAYRKAVKLEPDNEQASKSLGLFLTGKKDYRDALPYLLRYHEKYPEDRISLDALVSAYTAIGELEEVYKLMYRNWEKTGDVETGIRLTRFLLGQGKNEQAYDVVSKVSETTKTPRSLTELSLVLVVQERYEEAADILNQVLEIEPAFDRALRGLSFCYTKLGQMEDAIEFADKALSINNKHYRNWQAKGDALLALGKFDEALFTSQTALDLIDLKTDPEAEPVMEVLYLQRFNAFLGLGQVEEALQEIEKARTLLPNEERFYVYPAQLYLGLGQKEKALEILNKVAEAKLLDRFPYELRAKILAESGQFEKLWDWLDPQLGEPVIAFLTQLGYEAYLKGESDASLEIFDHLQEKYPQEPQLAINLSFMLTGQGEYERAEALLKPILSGQIEEVKPLATCNLGYILLAKGDTTLAKQMFESVLSSASDDSNAIVRVGFWQKEPAGLCCSPYPISSLPLKLAAMANLVAVFLQEDSVTKAEAMAKNILEHFPDASLTYQVMGGLEYFRGNNSGACKYWQKAVKLSSDRIEIEMIKGWLKPLGAA